MGTKGQLTYKVVELSIVTDDELERVVNAWVREGWTFDGVQFAMRDSSKRPAMAFVFFTRVDVSPDPSSTTPVPVDLG